MTKLQKAAWTVLTELDEFGMSCTSTNFVGEDGKKYLAVFAIGDEKVLAIQEFLRTSYETSEIELKGVK